MENVPPAPALRTPSLDTSTRDLADLARAGYQILQQPFTHVDFQVHHNTDRAGYLRGEVFTSRARLDQSEESMAVETLVSAAYGVGLVIGTNIGQLAGSSPMRRSDGAAAVLEIDEDNRRVFRGTALPNPAFLVESAQSYEGIVSVDPTPRSIRFDQSIAVRDLVCEISRVASEVANAPLLFMQGPVQLPSQGFVGQDLRSSEMRPVRRSSSLAVRFGIALHEPSARLRLELTDALRRYCTRNGFGLWVADTRIGYRSGNWFQICQQGDSLSRRNRGEYAGSRDSRPIEVCLPVTLIGPARTGSTYTIVSFLSQFESIGVTSCSITTLDDLLFIHLDLSASGLRRSRLQLLNSQLEGQVSWFANPTDALICIHEVLAPSDRQAIDHVRAGELMRHCGDFQTLIGPALGCVAPKKEKRIAIWFSWQMDGTGQDLTVPLAELLKCSSELGLADETTVTETDAGIPNVEYLICRDIGNFVLRGRGKLSIPVKDILSAFGGNGEEDAAVRLCVRLEAAWKSSLQSRRVRGVGELTVAVHEWWLGHWASPI